MPQKAVTKNTWSERFDEQFPAFYGVGAPFPIFKETPNRNWIKQFISSEIELAKQEERERIESVKNYLYDIEIPPGDAKIDVNFDVKYYAMKMEDKLKAEFVASKLKYWLKLQVLYLEKGLKKQIASLHQNNEQGGK